MQPYSPSEVHISSLCIIYILLTSKLPTEKLRAIKPDPDLTLVSSKCNCKKQPYVDLDSDIDVPPDANSGSDTIITQKRQTKARQRRLTSWRVISMEVLLLEYVTNFLLNQITDSCHQCSTCTRHVENPCLALTCHSWHTTCLPSRKLHVGVPLFYNQPIGHSVLIICLDTSTSLWYM